MQRPPDLPLIVVLMGIGAAAMLLPGVHALAAGDTGIAKAFLFSGLLALVVVAMIAIALQGRRPRDPERSQLASLAGAYVVLPLLLAVPFRQAVPDATYAEAWFEMLSCLTTTGATLYDRPGQLAPSLHLWRVLVGWLGGFLMLVGAAALLAPLNLGGAEVMTGRVPGRGLGPGGAREGGAGGRLARQAKLLFPAYAGLTLALWALLSMAGMSSFTALGFAMSTLASSGITPGTDLPAAAPGLAVEAMIFGFLCLSLSRRCLPGGPLIDRTRPFLRDPEIRTAAAILIPVTGVLFLRLVWAAAAQGSVEGPAEVLGALWAAMFMSLSFLTTSGFELGGWRDSLAWSGLSTPGLVLAGLAMAGGGIATTAGGLKLLRVYALTRHAERELHRFVHPSSVGGGGEVERRLRGDGAFAAWIFFMLYTLTLAVSIGALALADLPFDHALVLSIAAISTTGPLAAVAVEAPIRYAELGDGVRAVLAAGMVLGRLEVLAVLALLAPTAWRR